MKRKLKQRIFIGCGSFIAVELALDRFRLRDQIERRFEEHRRGEQKATFQQFLLPGSALTMSQERAINFKTMTYEPNWRYEEIFQFKKHYFPPGPGELEERTGAGR